MNKFFDYGYDDIQCDVKLPLPIIKEHDGINVVRDDLLDGGTKRRHLQCMSLHYQIQKSLFTLHQDKVMVNYLCYFSVKTWVENVP